MNGSISTSWARAVLLVALAASILPSASATDYWVRRPSGTPTPGVYDSISAALADPAVGPGDRLYVQGYAYNASPTPSPSWVYNESIKALATKGSLQIIGVVSTETPHMKPVILFDYANPPATWTPTPTPTGGTATPTPTPTPTGSLTASPTPTDSPIPNVVGLEFEGEFRNFRVSCANPPGAVAGIMIIAPCRVVTCDVDHITTGTAGSGIAAPCVSNPENDTPPIIDSCTASDNYQGFTSGEHEAVFQYCSAAGNVIGFGLDVGSCARVTNCWVENNSIGIRVDNDYYDCTPSATPAGGGSPTPTPDCSGWRNPGFVEISNVTVRWNTAKGIYICGTAGDNPSALVTVIRDSVIYQNGSSTSGSWGICCEGSQVYPTLKYNDVWDNHGVGGSNGDYYPSGMVIVNSISDDPLYNGRNLKQTGTPPYSTCVDRGSLSLAPGTAMTDYTLDTGFLDLGYHDVVPPEEAPGSLCAAAGDTEGSIDVSWTTPVHEEPVVYFRVSLLTSDLDRVETRIATGESYAFTEQQSGNYIVQVAAVDADGHSSQPASAPVSL
jgi:hypothetical protein